MTSALVAGISGGIGSAVARRLAGRGVQVHGVDDTVADGASRWRLDFSTSAHQADTWASSYLDEHGCPAMFAWCVGTYDRRPLTHYTLERVHEVLNVNLVGLLALVRRILLGHDGTSPLRVVVVSSQAGVTGGTDAVYAASKAGCTSVVKSLAREYARQGVVVNAVSPGPTETPMAAVMGERRRDYEERIPIGRFNTADEVASVVSWLLLESPASITGAVFDVDGGLVRR